MAKGSITKKAKKPTIRMGRSAVASMNRKNYGDEPEYNFIPLTMKEAAKAFNWYSLNCDRKQARQFVVEWLEDNNRTDDLAVIKKLSDSRVKAAMGTGCWIARMRTRGASFEADAMYTEWFDRGLRKARTYVNKLDDDVIEEDEDGNVTKVVMSTTKSKKFSHPSLRIPYYRTPAEQKFDRFLELMNAALDAIDIHDVGKPDYRYTFIDAIRKEQLDQVYARELLGELKDYERDLRDCLGADPEMTTANKHRASRLRRKQALVATLIIEVTTYLADVGKKAPKVDAKGEPVEVIRKPRKKKPISVDKMVSRLLYQEKDDELGLTSIPKTKVVGAHELWLYNTKYANLTVYRTEAEAGFTVRGTTLVGYDETTSVSKKIGRKAGEHTKNLMLSTKPQLRRFMDTISATPTKPNGRINENTILLRAL